MQSLRKILESKWFILILSLITVEFYIANLQIVPYLFYTVVVLLIIISQAKFYSFPVLYVSVLAFSRTGSDSEFNELIKNPLFISVIVAVALLVIALIYDLIKNRKEYFKKLKGNWLLYSLIIFLIPMFLSLINTPSMNDSLMFIGMYCLNFLTFIITLFKFDYTEKSKELMAWAFICVSILIGLEVMYMLAKHIENNQSFHDIVLVKDLNLGWAITTRYIVIFNIGIISSLYYALKNNFFSRLFVVIFLYFSLLINIIVACRAGFVGLAIAATIFILYYVFYFCKSQNRINEVISLLIIILFGMISLYFGYKTEFIEKSMEIFIDVGFKMSGRNEIWKLGLTLFNQNKIIGQGVYCGLTLIPQNLEYTWVSNFHNYIIDCLATMGILGLFAFTFFIYIIIHKCLRKNDMYATFMMILLAYYLGNGFFDTVFLNFQLMPIMIIPFVILPNNGLLRLKNEYYEQISVNNHS